MVYSSRKTAQYSAKSMTAQGYKSKAVKSSYFSMTEMKTLPCWTVVLVTKGAGA